MAVMGHPQPQPVTTAALLDRLREMLVELESGRRTGLDLLFGVAPERDGSWLLYERDLPRVRRVQDRHGLAGLGRALVHHTLHRQPEDDGDR